MAVLLTCGLSFTSMAYADCPRDRQVYVNQMADINGDGVLDYIVIPRPDVVPIPLDDDLIVPIPVPSRASGFLLVSQPNGTRAAQLLTNNQPPPGSWQPAPITVTLADFTASGCSGLVLRGLANSTSPSLSDNVILRLAGTGQLAGSQVLTSNADAYGLGSGTVQVTDQSGDGRQDLVHRTTDGLIQGVYLTQANGELRFDDDATITAIWTDFISLANVRDGRAMLYFASQVTERYGNQLNADSIHAMTRNIRAAGIQESNERFALFVVQRADVDGDTLYTVMFGKVGTGSWKIIGL